jgi:hypothetical protein
MARVTKILGSSVDLNDATAHFRNFGQFMAAVNVSNNHPDIEFADLKALMTGWNLDGTETNKPTMSLGRAIHQLNTSIDADAAAATATTQATQQTSGR